jgi:hypothetical protein
MTHALKLIYVFIIPICLQSMLIVEKESDMKICAWYNTFHGLPSIVQYEYIFWFYTPPRPFCSQFFVDKFFFRHYLLSMLKI